MNKFVLLTRALLTHFEASPEIWQPEIISNNFKDNPIDISSAEELAGSIWVFWAPLYVSYRA